MIKRSASSSLGNFLAILIGLVGGTVCHAEQVELHGQVSAVEEDTITIDLGESQRLAEGMQGEVYYEYLIGDTKKSIIIGQFEVTAVGELGSQGRILTRSGDIRPGRLVRFNLDISPGVGALLILSQPSGAQVTLDDKAVGQTNAEGLLLESIPSGLHTVRITRRFHRSITRTVVIQPEETTELNVNLERKWGNLVVTSVPAGADVQVEEQKRRTPHIFEHLPAGEYEIQVQMAGYYPEKRQTVVDNEETAILTVLLKKHAVLILEVSPKDAVVSVDGSPEQPAPLRLEGIPLGKHTITAHARDFESQTVEVTIQAGEEKHVPVTLKRVTLTLQIDSTPQGAVVALDREPQGKMPLQVEEVSTGAHTLSLKPKPATIVAPDLPEGTRIFVNDVSVTLPHKLSPGTHQIRLELEGFQPIEISEVLTPAQTFSLRPRWVQITPTDTESPHIYLIEPLEVNDTSRKVLIHPTGTPIKIVGLVTDNVGVASVLVDGHAMSLIAATQASGRVVQTQSLAISINDKTVRFEVEIVLPNDNPREVEIQAIDAAGNTATLLLHLTPPGKGTLLVKTTLMGAKIYIDGKFVAYAPKVIKDLPAGQRRIRLVLGERVYETVVTIRADATEKLSHSW